MATQCLLKMAEVVMNKILAELNYLSIMTLRKVCHNLRTYIEDVKPDANFSQIMVHLENDHIDLHYQLLYERGKIVKYCLRENGCMVQHDDKEWIFERETPNELFYRDFECILKFQKTKLEFLQILGRNYANFDEFLEKTGKIFKDSGNILKVETFTFDPSTQKQVMMFLPYFEPRVLKEISLQQYRQPLRMNRIVQLEQWKQCEIVCVRNRIINPGIKHFLHLTEAVLTFHNISPKDVVAVKEAMIRTPAMQIFNIHYQNRGVERRFENLVGQPVIFDEEDPKRWFFRLPDTPDEVLCLRSNVEYDMYFKFEKIPTILVREGTLLYD